MACGAFICLDGAAPPAPRLAPSASAGVLAAGDGVEGAAPWRWPATPCEDADDDGAAGKSGGGGGDEFFLMNDDPFLPPPSPAAAGPSSYPSSPPPRPPEPGAAQGPRLTDSAEKALASEGIWGGGRKGPSAKGAPEMQAPRQEEQGRKRACMHTRGDSCVGVGVRTFLNDVLAVLRALVPLARDWRVGQLRPVRTDGRG